MQARRELRRLLGTRIRPLEGLGELRIDLAKLLRLAVRRPTAVGHVDRRRWRAAIGLILLQQGGHRLVRRGRRQRPRRGRRPEATAAACAAATTRELSPELTLEAEAGDSRRLAAAGRARSQRGAGRRHSARDGRDELSVVLLPAQRLLVRPLSPELPPPTAAGRCTR